MHRMWASVICQPYILNLVMYVSWLYMIQVKITFYILKPGGICKVYIKGKQFAEV